jgi:hypothetical protein
VWVGFHAEFADEAAGEMGGVLVFAHGAVPDCGCWLV